jgi:hypothetical protein
MTDVGDLLWRVAEAGVTLTYSPEADKLVAKPTARVTPELVAALKERRGEVIRALRTFRGILRDGAEPHVRCWYHDKPPYDCWLCNGFAKWAFDDDAERLLRAVSPPSDIEALRQEFLRYRDAVREYIYGEPDWLMDQFEQLSWNWEDACRRIGEDALGPTEHTTIVEGVLMWWQDQEQERRIRQMEDEGLSWPEMLDRMYLGMTEEDDA